MLGEYYVKDEEFVPFSFFRSLRKCIYVPDEGKVVKYENFEGKKEEWFKLIYKIIIYNI